MSRYSRWASAVVGVGLTTALLAVSTGGPVMAAAPYVVDPARDRAPAVTVAGPEAPEKWKRRYECAQSAVLREGNRPSQFDYIPMAQAAYPLDEMHKFATGKGQTVAVIDSGVNPNKRLKGLVGGGDFIEGGDGLFDCDAHGTLVAGLIAAQPQQGDGFKGVAPDASILSIRQTSERYELDNPPRGYTDREKANTSRRTLAKAIVLAAQKNATVINISVTSCVAASDPVDLRELAGALYFASVVKNIVVVAAAGNLGGDCAANPGPTPSDPRDKRGWGSAGVLSLPSMFDTMVLSVGATTLTGDPFSGTMPGPWVGVGSPGVNIVSLDPSKGREGALVNGTNVPDKGVIPNAGTSFSSAAVAGLAALLRERYPKLTAHQIIERIKQTASTPSSGISNAIGAGVVYPMDALTSPLDTTIPVVAEGIQPMQAYSEGPPPPPDHLGRNVTIAALLGVVVVAVVVAVAGLATRRPDQKGKA